MSSYSTSLVSSPLHAVVAVQNFYVIFYVLDTNLNLFT